MRNNENDFVKLWKVMKTAHCQCIAAMGPMVEVVVVVEVAAAAVLTKATVSPLVRVIASRATEATTRALTAAPAPTAREDIAAMVKPSQVDSVTVQNSQFLCHTLWCS